MVTFMLHAQVTAFNNLVKQVRTPPGRKTPPGVSAPSPGLRPLIVSRVKCGADLVAATQCYRVREIRYAFIAPL